MSNHTTKKSAGIIFAAILFFTSSTALAFNATGSAEKDFAYTNIRLNTEASGSEADLAALTSLLQPDARSAATTLQGGNNLLSLEQFSNRFPALFQKPEWPTRESLKESLQGLTSGYKNPLAGAQAAGALAAGALAAGAYAGSQAASMPVQGNTAQVNTGSTYGEASASVPPLVVPPLVTQQQGVVQAFAEPPQGPAALRTPTQNPQPFEDDYTEEEIAAANARHNEGLASGIASDGSGLPKLVDAENVLSPMAEEAPKVEEPPASAPVKSGALLQFHGSQGVMLGICALLWQLVIS